MWLADDDLEAGNDSGIFGLDSDQLGTCPVRLGQDLALEHTNYHKYGTHEMS
jgi:hypothetical protein